MPADVNVGEIGEIDAIISFAYADVDLFLACQWEGRYPTTFFESPEDSTCIWRIEFDPTALSHFCGQVG